MSGELIARYFGQTLGGFIVIFLISRLIRLYFFKSRIASNTVLVSIYSFSIVAFIASFGFDGVLKAILNYAPAAVIVLIYELVQDHRENFKKISDNKSNDKGEL